MVTVFSHHLVIDNAGLCVYECKGGVIRSTSIDLRPAEFVEKHDFALYTTVDIAHPDSITEAHLAIFESLLRHHRAIKIMAERKRRRGLVANQDEYIGDIRRFVDKYTSTQRETNASQLRPAAE
jgi:hypothetical protein